MANDIKWSVALRNTLGDAIVTALGNAALIRLYSGTKPAGPGTAIGVQTLLGTLTCASPPAGSTSNGVITFSAIVGDSAADASNTVTWARFLTSGGTAVMDVTVGTGSGFDLIANNTTVTAGNPLNMTSLTLTVPCA